MANLAFIATTNISQVMGEIQRELRAGEQVLQQRSAAIRKALQAPLLGPQGAAGGTQANLISAYTGQVEQATRNAAKDLQDAAKPFQQAIQTVAGGGAAARPGSQTFRQVGQGLQTKFLSDLDQQIQSFYRGIDPALRNDPATIAMAQNIRRQAVEGFTRIQQQMALALQQDAIAAGADIRKLGLGGTRALPIARAAVLDPASLGGTPQQQALIQAQAQSSLMAGTGISKQAQANANRIIRGTQQAAQRAADQAARDYADQLARAIEANTNQATRQLLDPSGARRLQAGKTFGLVQGPQGELAQFYAGGTKAYDVSKGLGGKYSEAEEIAAMQRRIDYLNAAGQAEGKVQAQAIAAMQRRVDAMNADAQRMGRMQAQAQRMNAEYDEALRKETQERRENARSEARRRRVSEGIETGQYRRVTGDYYMHTPTGAVRNVSAAGGGRVVDPGDDPRLRHALHQENLRLQQRLRSMQRGGFMRGITDPDARGALTAENIGLTTRNFARYAAAGAVIGGITAAFADTKREAIDFRDSLTDLEVAFGRGEKVSGDYVDSLERFSRLAGANVGAALDAAARGVRAFGDAQQDTRADMESIGLATTEQANVLSVIAGKPLKDATGDLIAVATSFELQADTLGRANEAIASAKALGGDPNQIAQGLANGATAFREAGFDLEQSAGIISVVQARLDQTGQATATRLSRVFQIARGGQAQAAFQALGIGQGTLAEQFGALARLRQEGKLTDDQMSELLKTIGGTANTREAIALMDNFAAVQDNVTTAMLDGGRATDEYNRKNSDLAGLFRKIAGDIANIQVNVVESGVLAPIGLALNALEPMLRLLNEILQTWNKMPSVMRNVLAVVLELGAAGFMLSRSFGRSADRLSDAVKAGDAAGIAAALRPSLFQRALTPVALPAAGGLIGGVRRLPGRIGEGARELGRQTGVTSLGAFMRTPAAMAVAGAAMVTAVMTAVDALQRLRDAAEGAADTIEGLDAAEGVEGLQAAIQSLTAQANAERESAGGFWGGIFRATSPGVGPVAGETTGQVITREVFGLGDRLFEALDFGDLGRKLRESAAAGWVRERLGGSRDPDATDDPLARAEQFDDAARIYNDILENLEEKLLDVGTSAGVFGGAIDSVSDLEQGIAALDAAGASAVDRVEAIRAALGGIAGEEIPPGTVMPGGSAILAQELATDFHNLAMDAVAQGIGGAERERLVNRQRFLEGEGDDEGALARAEREARLGRTGEVRERGRARAERLRGEIEDIGNRLKEFDDEAAKAVEGIPELTAPDRIAATTERLQGVLTGYLDEIGMAGGGVLSEAQIEEAAQRMAEVLPDLSDVQRRILVQAMIDNIRNRTTASIAEMDPALARALQVQLLADAQAYGERAALQGADPIAAARESQRVIQDAAQIDVIRGKPISSDVRAASLQQQRDIRELVRARDEALDRSLIAAGDVTAEARLDERLAQEAVDRLESAGRDIGEDGKQTQEYSEALIALRDAQHELGRIERENARAARDRLRDPRNDVLAAWDEYDDLIEDAEAANDPGERDRLYAQARRQQIEAQELGRRRRQNRRRARIDPRDVIGDAREDLRTAEENLAAASESQSDYGELQRDVTEARQALARAEADQASAARRADNYPGSELQQAADDIEDALDLMDLALMGQADYWDAMGQLHQAQIGYAEAQLQHVSILRQLGGDISDPVFMANEELRAARDQLALAQREGAPPDVIAAREFDVRQAELNAEQTAFDERMRAARVANDLGRMSHAAYLQYLNDEAERLRAIQDRTHQQQLMLDEVDQAIKAANDQMSGQFNLGDINVPTVFEVRRSMEAQQIGAGAGVVTEVVNNVSINGADLVQVKSYIDTLIGPQASDRVTVAPRKI